MDKSIDWKKEYMSCAKLSTYFRKNFLTVKIEQYFSFMIVTMTILFYARKVNSLNDVMIRIVKSLMQI